MLIWQWQLDIYAIHREIYESQTRLNRATAPLPNWLDVDVITICIENAQFKLGSLFCACCPTRHLVWIEPAFIASLCPSNIQIQSPLLLGYSILIQTEQGFDWALQHLIINILCIHGGSQCSKYTFHSHCYHLHSYISHSFRQFLRWYRCIMGR